VQIRDEGLWQELVKELKESDHGLAFYDFLVGWVDRAEQIVKQDGEDADPTDALRLSLADVEENLERKNVWIVGQALVVICMHWIYGEQTSAGFTELEARLVQDVTAAKIAQLQAMAETAGVSTAPE
jgi:hypothetical protein